MFRNILTCRRSKNFHSCVQNSICVIEKLSPGKIVSAILSFQRNGLMEIRVSHPVLSIRPQKALRPNVFRRNAIHDVFIDQLLCIVNLSVGSLERHSNLWCLQFRCELDTVRFHKRNTFVMCWDLGAVCTVKVGAEGCSTSNVCLSSHGTWNTGIHLRTHPLDFC